MKALILVGGLGTRLKSVISDRPKPLAEVRGKPFLAYQLEFLRAQGLREFVLCLGHQGVQIRDYLGDGRRLGVGIAYAVETEPLGTAGAIRNARDFLDGDFLVLNGDSYLELDFQALVESHRRWRSVDRQMVGTIATVPVDDAAAYGALEFDASGRIQRFGEKARAGPGWINGGVYALEPKILDFIPDGRAVSIEKETFPLALARGRHLWSYPVEGFFVDIGTPEGYECFRHYIQERTS